MKSHSIYRKKTVLLAEDDVSVRDVFAQALHESGFDVIVAVNGEEALGKAQTSFQMGFPIDLLITDIRMPILSGQDLILQLEKHGLYIPILVLSGFGDKDLVIDLMRMGCRDYIDKPCRINDLIDRVKVVLENEEERRSKISRYLHQVEKDKVIFSVNTHLKHHDRKIQTRMMNGFFTFDIEGELDDTAASHLRGMVDEAVEKGQYNLLLNFKGSSTISSYGIGVIIYLWKSLKSLRGTLYLVSGDSHIFRKIEELNLSRIIRVFKSEADFTAFLEQTQIVNVNGRSHE